MTNEPTDRGFPPVVQTERPETATSTVAATEKEDSSEKSPNGHFPGQEMAGAKTTACAWAK